MSTNLKLLIWPLYVFRVDVMYVKFSKHPFYTLIWAFLNLDSNLYSTSCYVLNNTFCLSWKLIFQLLHLCQKSKQPLPSIISVLLSLNTKWRDILLSLNSAEQVKLSYRSISACICTSRRPETTHSIVWPMQPMLRFSLILGRFSEMEWVSPFLFCVVCGIWLAMMT